MKQGMEILTLENKSNWDDIVQSSNCYDFYHLSSYHHIAELRGEGKAYLFVYKENNKFIAIPFLLRPIWEIDGLEEIGKDWFDATSVYGYLGPVSNVRSEKIDFFLKFGKAMLEFLKEKSVVIAFSRLHPICQNHKFLKIGELVKLGRTVSINLSLSLEKQRSFFMKGHKYSINKAHKEGVSVYLDAKWEHFEKFIYLYNMTMDKVKASRYYYFEKQYFYSLRNALVDSLKLFVAEYKGQIISAALFTLCNSITQYYLSGSDPKYNKLAPSKIIIDKVRIWGTEQKIKFFHLGGGLGSSEDGLFHFKAGFSNRQHQFFMWKLVVNHSVYEDLKKAHEKWRKENHWELINSDYFPPYRSDLKK